MTKDELIAENKKLKHEAEKAQMQREILDMKYEKDVLFYQLEIQKMKKLYDSSDGIIGYRVEL